MKQLSFILAASLILSIGCGGDDDDDDDNVTVDATPTATFDASPTDPDAATPGIDASPTDPDASAPGIDASIPDTDASAPGIDASAPGVDASMPTADASMGPTTDGGGPGITLNEACTTLCAKYDSLSCPDQGGAGCVSECETTYASCPADQIPRINGCGTNPMMCDPIASCLAGVSCS